MSNHTGFLTILSADRREIYGEFADADWQEISTNRGKHRVFSGVAGDGTFEAFQRINDQGISHVAYIFESDDLKFEGAADLMAPIEDQGPTHAVIRIESTVS